MATEEAIKSLIEQLKITPGDLAIQLTRDTSVSPLAIVPELADGYIDQLGSWSWDRFFLELAISLVAEEMMKDPNIQTESDRRDDEVGPPPSFRPRLPDQSGF